MDVKSATTTLLASGLALLVGVVGCAGLHHRAVASFDKIDGIPYYGGAHYLLVYSDGKGGVVSKLLYLPDRNQKRVAKPSQVFASLNSTLKFSNGMIEKSEAVGDATAVPKAVVQAIGRVAPLLLAAAANAAREGTGYTVPAPQLYRVTWDQGQLHLVGGAGNERIHVSLVGGK